MAALLDVDCVACGAVRIPIEADAVDPSLGAACFATLFGPRTHVPLPWDNDFDDARVFEATDRFGPIRRSTNAYNQTVSDPSVPCLSGAVFLRNEKMFRREVGDAVVDRARQALSIRDLDVLDSAVPAAWIPVSIIDAFYREIAHQAGRDLESFYVSVVKQGISETLRSVWKALLRLTSDRALISRTPIIYARGHSVGKVVPTITAPGRATVALTGWPEMPDLRRLGVAAGVEAVLEMAGRKNVSVEFEATPDGAVYQARWDV